MAFVDFTAGDVFTAANADVLMRQSIMRFADSSARDTALTGVLAEGLVAYLDDVNAITVYNGSAWITFGGIGAWTSHTPTLAQGASSNIAKTTNYSAYAVMGKTVIWNFNISATAAGTAGSAVTVTLPVAASSTAGIAGAGQVFDASTNTSYTGVLKTGGSTSLASLLVDGVSSGTSWGQFPNLAIASGDTFVGSITYEAA